MKILVADDEQVMRDLFAQVLELKGHQCVGVDCAQAVLDRTASESFDMIFLDVMMPEMDGVDVLKTLLKNKVGSVVVMMTGFAVEDKIREAMRLGAFDFLYKPFNIVDLVSLLEKADKRRQLKPVDGQE